MPETKRLYGLRLIEITEPNSPERHLAGLALDVQAGQRDTATSVTRRNEAIRTMRADGASLGRLATLSGLSIAQVQRICDLSKDHVAECTCGHVAHTGRCIGYVNCGCDLSKDRSE